jgi:ribonuclease T2
MKAATMWLMLLALCFATTAVARKHAKGSQKNATFDYYLLSLSWAPTYCESHPNDNSSECKTGNHTGFVLHGLWPSSNTAPMQPESCGNASPVAFSTVRHMREYFPSNGLIQHEWQKHGTCSGLSAQEYFATVEKAYKGVKVPDKYANMGQQLQLTVHDIEKDFADGNNAPAGAFRVSCHAGELVALEACLDKDLKYQACPRTARECPADQVKLAPPK